MAKHPRPGNPEKYRLQLIELLENFEEHLKSSELREQVLQLVPAIDLLQNIGSSLIQGSDGNSAQSRILAYLRKYPGLNHYWRRIDGRSRDFRICKTYQRIESSMWCYS